MAEPTGFRHPGIHARPYSSRNWLIFLLRYALLPILVLILAHYTLIFFLQLNTLPIYMSTIYTAIVFLFGYDLFRRTGTNIAVACILGLLVGIVAVSGMSAVAYLLLHQDFFPDKRQVQDFIEVSMAIMLSYAAGAATASFLQQLLPETLGHQRFASTLRELIALARGRSERTLTERLLSLEAAVKAMVAVVLAIGSLLFAVKKVFF